MKPDNQSAPVTVPLPPYTHPLRDSKHWDDGIDRPVASERALRLEREDQLREALQCIGRLKGALTRCFVYMDKGNPNEFYSVCPICRAANVHVGANAGPVIHKPECWYGAALEDKTYVG